MRIEVIDEIAAYAHGHHDPESFCAAVKKNADADFAGLDNPDPKTVYHSWLRHNPDSSKTYKSIVAQGTPGQRGSFSATIIDFDQSLAWRAYKEFPCQKSS